MKPIHEWISDMADKYEDTSIIAKPKYSCINVTSVDTSKKVSSLTALQKRALWADLGVPVTTSYATADLWIKAFCMSATGTTVSLETRIGAVFDSRWTKIQEEEHDKAIKFIKELKEYIA